jgi:hypothetical protein
MFLLSTSFKYIFVKTWTEHIACSSYGDFCQSVQSAFLLSQKSLVPFFNPNQYSNYYFKTSFKNHCEIPSGMEFTQKRLNFWVGEMAKVVECLPSKHKTSECKLQYHKKRKKKKGVTFCDPVQVTLPLWI